MLKPFALYADSKVTCAVKIKSRWFQQPTEPKSIKWRNGHCRAVAKVTAAPEQNSTPQRLATLYCRG